MKTINLQILIHNWTITPQILSPLYLRDKPLENKKTGAAQKLRNAVKQVNKLQNTSIALSNQYDNVSIVASRKRRVTLPYYIYCN